ncbi:hypothetical protein G6O69_32435 [Pseudenhygromyxa sp. WMMC2535]|nr:hypothetical protein [Pseudenhygromyxa sp. WMMC2535]
MTSACSDDGNADTTGEDIGTETDTDTTDTSTETTTDTGTETDTTTDTETETETGTETDTDTGTETDTETDTDTEGGACVGNDGTSEETAASSCLEILENGCSVGDGSYWVMPGEVAFETNCDMTTDGGGWTEISLPHLCNGDLVTTMTAIEAAEEEGIDDACRPFTADGAGDHTYVFDVEFPPTFEAFYLSDYSMRANGDDPSGILGALFTQSDWNDANGGTVQGDVSFGSADDLGPVVSYGSENEEVNCDSCETVFASNDTPFSVGAASASFRIGWGEAGSEDEGWYPWWAGSVYLR